MYEQQESKDFTELQHKKFLVLYALFLDRARHQKKDVPNFFEFAEKFLESDAASERASPSQSYEKLSL